MKVLGWFLELAFISMIVSPLFWWFLVELAEHGWK